MFSHGASQVWLTWDRANTNTDGEAHKPGVDTGQDSEKVLVIPVLTLWPSPSNGPLTLVLMPCSVPNVLIVMVCNLLLLSVPGRNELAEQEEKDQKNIDLGMSLFKRERSIEQRRCSLVGQGAETQPMHDIHALFYDRHEVYHSLQRDDDMW